MALKTPLLTNIELTDCENNDISLKTVINNHEILLNNDMSTDSKIFEIIDILGGMDIVLTNYLNIDHLHKFNSNQLNQINNILLSILNDKGTKKQKTNVNDMNAILYVSSNDTWFHNICKV